MMFRKWTSINKFSDIYKLANKFGVGEVDYLFKVKLHGTNAAIRIEDGKLIPQKRSSDISVDDDNMGFAKFVDSLDVNTDNVNGYIFYGEWAGPGIQKTDAVSMIEEPHFFVFDVYDTKNEMHIYRPDVIHEMVQILGADRIETIRWEHMDTVNFLDQEDSQRFIDCVMKKVDEIGKEDPLIKDYFGVVGPGEGLVGYPVNGDFPLEFATDYMFKAKTEIHSVNKSKNRNHVAPEKPEGVDEFLDMFFTEARFRQMLDESLGGVADRKKTGDFLKAVMKDVHKESVNEIEEADFDWKTVSRYGPNRIKNWFFKECDKL